MTKPEGKPKMSKDQFVLKREAVPNEDDGQRTTLHMAQVVCKSCNHVSVMVKNADKHVAESLARHAHKLNGSTCEGCHSTGSVARVFVPDLGPATA